MTDRQAMVQDITISESGHRVTTEITTHLHAEKPFQSTTYLVVTAHCCGCVPFVNVSAAVLVLWHGHKEQMSVLVALSLKFKY